MQSVSTARRISAIARTSAKLASEGSITAVLDALAEEVQQADALAAVQILTVDRTGTELQLMGSVSGILLLTPPPFCDTDELTRPEESAS